ncbi:MAG TPA: cellulase family glycosylhydrolase [Candidatus Competibacter sp.]|nr:cellulase family glycosylhydrolase [Candidatus Competibacter sp.]HUM95470.1 cellulase family glycosylhydrolase [Candidatus Competibacter sp.]
MNASIDRKTASAGSRCCAIVMGLLLLLLALSGGPAAGEELAPALRRGVNLSHWLQYQGRQPITAADMAAIRQAGFDHVRLPFDPERLGWKPDGQGVAAESWPGLIELDQAIDLALAADLAVILDFHPESALRDRIETEARIGKAFVQAWRALAARYAKRPVERLAFAPLNEPQYYSFDGARRWRRLQADVVSAIRQQAPSHWVLLSGTRGSSIAGLQLMTPLVDPRVRYVFHFYEPMLLTHLNAPWEPFQSGPQGMVADLKYGADPAQTLALARPLPGADAKIAKAAIEEYAAEEWSARRIAQEIAKAAAWAQQHNVKLVCTEFGIFRNAADAASRNLWLRDVRVALENAGIGWSVWDYADFFGIATAAGKVAKTADGAPIPGDPKNPVRQFDPETLTALGLKP